MTVQRAQRVKRAESSGKSGDKISGKSSERKGIKVDLARRSEIGRERRRKKLLDILTRVVGFLSEQSFEQTAIEEIASASGVSTRTFYNYFQKKDDIATAIDDLLFEIAAHSDNREPPDGADTVERVAFGMLANMNFGALEPEITRVSFDLYLSKYPDFQSFWVRAGDHSMLDYEQGVSEKVFARMEPQLMLDFVATPQYFLTHQIASTRFRNREEIMRQGAVLALVALGTDKRKATRSVNAMLPYLPSEENAAVQAAYDSVVEKILS